jgi:hypothetical protein
MRKPLQTKQASVVLWRTLADSNLSFWICLPKILVVSSVFWHAESEELARVNSCHDVIELDATGLAALYATWFSDQFLCKYSLLLSHCTCVLFTTESHLATLYVSQLFLQFWRKDSFLAYSSCVPDCSTLSFVSCRYIAYFQPPNESAQLLFIKYSPNLTASCASTFLCLLVSFFYPPEIRSVSLIQLVHEQHTNISSNRNHLRWIEWKVYIWKELEKKGRMYLW